MTEDDVIDRKNKGYNPLSLKFKNLDYNLLFSHNEKLRLQPPIFKF